METNGFAEAHALNVVVQTQYFMKAHGVMAQLCIAMIVAMIVLITKLLDKHDAERGRKRAQKKIILSMIFFYIIIVRFA